MKSTLRSITAMLAMLTAIITSATGRDPVSDGREMMYLAISALKDGNHHTADSVIGKYVDDYSGMEPGKRIGFVNGCSESYWNIMAENPTPEWEAFFTKMRPLMEWYITSGETLQSLPNFERLKNLRGTTIGMPSERH